MKLIPENPGEKQAEREAWEEGVHLLSKINTARAQTNEEPLKVNEDNAPESIKAEKRARKEAAEIARINEQTRAAELEAARLEGKLEALQERKQRCEPNQPQPFTKAWLRLTSGL